MTRKNGFIALAACLLAGPAFAAGQQSQDSSMQMQQPAGQASAQQDMTNPLSDSLVRNVQQALQQQGHDIRADGTWGPNTQQALTQFQQDNDLQANGQIDLATIEALGLQGQQTAQMEQAQQTAQLSEQAQETAEAGQAEMQAEASTEELGVGESQDQAQAEEPAQAEDQDEF